MAKPPKKSQHTPAQRLLIVMPNSLSQTVMATPTLRAFRQLYPDAHITALVRRHLRPIIEGCPWINRIVSARHKSKHAPKSKRTRPIRLAARLAKARFDTAVLLPEGLRAALLVRLAGIPRRVGYDRDARSGVLTDRLMPRRIKGEYVPVPTREQYLGLARYLGAVDTDPTMKLFTRPDDDEQAQAMLNTYGVQSQINPATGLPTRPLILIVPGAGQDQTKMWPVVRFGELADRLAGELNAVVAMVGSSSERSLLESVKKHANTPLIDLHEQGVDLTMLKSIIRLSHLVVTNDTGPRHMAAAFDTPLVTLTGSEDRTWSDTALHHEIQVATGDQSQTQTTKKSKRSESLSVIDVPAVFDHAVNAMREAIARQEAAAAAAAAPAPGVLA